MRHLLINLGENQVHTWWEAFPEGLAVSTRDLGSIEVGVDAIIWVRLLGEQNPDILEYLRRDYPGVPVVVLSDQPGDAAAGECFAAGAAGYCNSHAAPSVLEQVSGVVAQGGVWLGQGLLQRLMVGTSALLKRTGRVVSDDLKQYGLTERELDVAKKVAAGASNREIAEELKVTERTVKAHLSTIFMKLQVRDRLQLSLKVNGV